MTDLIQIESDEKTPEALASAEFIRLLIEGSLREAKEKGIELVLTHKEGTFDLKASMFVTAIDYIMSDLGQQLGPYPVHTVINCFDLYLQNAQMVVPQ